MYQQKSRTTALFKKGMDWTHLCSCRLIIPAPVRAFANRHTTGQHGSTSMSLSSATPSSHWCTLRRSTGAMEHLIRTAQVPASTAMEASTIRTSTASWRKSPRWPPKNTTKVCPAWVPKRSSPFSCAMWTPTLPCLRDRNALPHLSR